MTSTQQRLNEYCTARLPQVKFESNITAKEVRENWTEPLLVHSVASGRLCQDLKFFVEGWRYTINDAAGQFLLSTYHHMVVLLAPTFEAFRNGLREHLEVQASDRYLKGILPSIGDLLALAGKRLSDLHKSWEYAVRDLELKTESYDNLLGRAVPTASPRALLIRVLVNQESILDEIAMGADTALADIGKYLNLPAAPEFSGEKFRLKRVIADGIPKTIFICNHVTNGNRVLYVGSNQADWGGLSEIGKIRRADRDYRLEPYIPLVKKAYDALREAEKNIILPDSMANLTSNARTYEIRMRAISEMSDAPHPDFLGRKTEIGQAFDKLMRPRQCCYFCQGMVGYKVPTKFESAGDREYLLRQEWHLRGDYAHSCAEIDASYQCGTNWAENGKDIKY